MFSNTHKDALNNVFLKYNVNVKNVIFYSKHNIIKVYLDAKVPPGKLIRADLIAAGYKARQISYSEANDCCWLCKVL